MTLYYYIMWDILYNRVSQNHIDAIMCLIIDFFKRIIDFKNIFSIFLLHFNDKST